MDIVLIVEQCKGQGCDNYSYVPYLVGWGGFSSLGVWPPVQGIEGSGF